MSYRQSTGDVVEAVVGSLLGKGTYATAWALLPPRGGEGAATAGPPLAVMKVFRRPDAALAALFGHACAEEAAAQWARERRAGEALRLGPALHAGFAHVAQLLSSDAQLVLAGGGSAACAPPRLLVHEFAGQSLARRETLTRLGFAARLSVAVQLAQAASLLRLHDIVHADINAENCCLDVDGRLRLIDFGNAVVLEGARQRAQTCERLAKLRTKYLHHPRFPASERFGFPTSVAQLIADIERPRGLSVYSGPGTAYDPEMLPGNLAATPPEALRGTLQPGASDVYGVAILLWWLLTAEETPFEIDIDGDRAHFFGWADFYSRSGEEQLAWLREGLDRRCLPELRAEASPGQLSATAAWIAAALVEAPERRPAEGPVALAAAAAAAARTA